MLESSLYCTFQRSLEVPQGQGVGLTDGKTESQKGLNICPKSLRVTSRIRIRVAMPQVKCVFFSSHQDPEGLVHSCSGRHTQETVERQSLLG